jgi:hypothetical protein
MRKISHFKLLVTLLFVGPKLAFGALDNPDIIGAEPDYNLGATNPDLLPIVVVVCILLVLLVFKPKE